MSADPMVLTSGGNWCLLPDGRTMDGALASRPSRVDGVPVSSWILAKTVRPRTAQWNMVSASRETR